MEEIKVGDIVKSIDGSGSLLIKSGFAKHIYGLDLNRRKLLVKQRLHSDVDLFGEKAHDIVLEDINTGETIIHSVAFVKKIASTARKNIPIDHPVWVAEKVEYSNGYRWVKRHFAGWDKKGDMLIWIGGKTSHSFNGTASGTESFDIWYWEELK